MKNSYVESSVSREEISFFSLSIKKEADVVKSDAWYQRRATLDRLDMLTQLSKMMNSCSGRTSIEYLKHFRDISNEVLNTAHIEPVYVSHLMFNLVEQGKVLLDETIENYNAELATEICRSIGAMYTFVIKEKTKNHTL